MPNCFKKVLYRFTFLPVVYEDSSSSTSLPIDTRSAFLNHCKVDVVVCHCTLNCIFLSMLLNIFPSIICLISYFFDGMSI